MKKYFPSIFVNSEVDVPDFLYNNEYSGDQDMSPSLLCYELIPGKLVSD